MSNRVTMPLGRPFVPKNEAEVHEILRLEVPLLKRTKRDRAFCETVCRSGKLSEDGLTVQIARGIYENILTRYPAAMSDTTSVKTASYDEVLQKVAALSGDSSEEKWVKSMVAQQQLILNRPCTNCQKAHAEKKIRYYWEEYQRLLSERQSKV